MRAAAVIVAGGQGTRMKLTRNKVFVEVAGRSILDWSLSLLESVAGITEVVLVARAEDIPACESLKSRFGKLSRIVPGGDVRHRSEFAGLKALAGRIDADEIDRVLVHDAVRPFASQRLVGRLLTGDGRSVGCIPGLPVTSTTVLVDAGFIAGYPSNVWTIQTPQAFEATWLLEAHNKAARQAFLGTDTASVVEWAGGEVAVIEGEADNIKITTPEDLSRAERIAATRQAAG
jgi:2-C-methyl-D-erythritol 4-phosphate cytidylyltransferase